MTEQKCYMGTKHKPKRTLSKYLKVYCYVVITYLWLRTVVSHTWLRGVIWFVFEEKTLNAFIKYQRTSTNGHVVMRKWPKGKISRENVVISYFFNYCSGHLDTDHYDLPRESSKWLWSNVNEILVFFVTMNSFRSCMIYKGKIRHFCIQQFLE